MDDQTAPETADAAPAPAPVPAPAPTPSFAYGKPQGPVDDYLDQVRPGQGYVGPTEPAYSGMEGLIRGVGSAAKSVANAGMEQPGAAPPSASPEAEAGDQVFPGIEGGHLWQNFTDGLQLGAYSQESDLRQFSLHDAINQSIDDIKQATGVELQNPYVGALETGPDAVANFQKGLADLLGKYQGDTPEDAKIRDVIKGAMNPEQLADQFVKNTRDRAAADYASSQGTLLPWAARAAGEMAGQFRNPINLLSLAVGGPGLESSTAIGRVLEAGANAAIANMGLTAAQEPGFQARHEQLGEEHGFWPMMADIENSALGGFVGGGLIHGLTEIGRFFRPGADQSVAVEEFLRRAQNQPPPGGWPAGSEGRGSTWERDVAEWMAQRAAAARSRAVVPFEGPDNMGYPAEGMAPEPSPGTPPNAAFGGTVAWSASGLPKEMTPPKLNTPDAIANLPKTTEVTPAAIESASNDVAAAPRIPPEQTKGDALATYEALIQHGEAPDVVAPPIMPPRTPDEIPPASPQSTSLPKATQGETFTKEGKPVTFQTFDPLQLGTNAQVFQYKGGGDEAGVTDRLRSVKQWDTMAADPMVVYQWNDGTLTVADGHQRTGLAKALAGQGLLPPNTTIPGYLFRESDGWTPQDVRAFAAKRNLQQGSGDVIDTARILRERPDIWDKSLPTSSPALKQAKGLSELSDDGWGMVVNGMVKPNLAALVGQGLADKTQHAAMLKSVIDFKNADENSTRMMIADANAIGWDTEDRADLFGDTPVARNLLNERAAVYSRVIQALRDDKRIFGLLDREATRIEEAGNQLAGETNVAQADRAGQLASILEKLAVRQGPVSAALNRAAKTVADGAKPQAAARSFLRDIDRLMREEGLKLTIPPPLEAKPGIDLTTPEGNEARTAQIRQTMPQTPDELFGSQSKPIEAQRQAIFDDMRQKLIDADMPPVQADANAAVIAARYVTRAARLGRTDPETLYRSQGIMVRGDRQRAEMGAQTPFDKSAGLPPAYREPNARITLRDWVGKETILDQPTTVPTFYSSVERAVENAKQAKASGPQWAAMLKNMPGVKPEEMKWLGLEDWLKGQKEPITKQAVADYVRANAIEVTEVTKDNALVSDVDDEDQGDATKFSTYTLPGGGNYRELLLTLPHATLERPIGEGEFAQRPFVAPYESPHWEEKNVLAHIRFDDRTIDGKRALLIEEIQSDWHQQGRRLGYGAGGVPDAPFKTTWPELSLKRMIRYASERGYDKIAWVPGEEQAQRYDLSKQIQRIRLEDNTSGGIGRPRMEGEFKSGMLTAVDHDGREVIHRYVTADELADHIGKEAAEKLIAVTPKEGRSAGMGVRVRELSGLDLKVGGEGMKGFYDKILPAAATKLVKKFGAKVETANVPAGLGPFEYQGPDRTASEMDAIMSRAPSVALARQARLVADTMRAGESFADAMSLEGSHFLAELAGGRMVAPDVHVQVHSIDITPELRDAAVNEGFPLFAKAPTEAEPRGRITIRDDSAIIDLFRNRDESSFMHESGHLFLEELGSDAEDGDAPQQIKDDWATVLDWLGAKPREPLTTAQHEKFARGFEQYLREGKAPSEGLRGVFEQFKDWLKAIYRSLRGLGKEIPDAIRGVMDRMLATDEEIAANRATAREAARQPPATNADKAQAQAAAYAKQMIDSVNAALEESGTPLDREAREFVRQNLEPVVASMSAPVSPAQPVEPLPMPGTKLDKTVDLRASGLRPRGRADGASSVGSAQVVWSAAQQSGKNAIAVLTRNGWSVLRPTEGVGYGQPHIEVTPEGLARFYGPDLGPAPSAADYTSRIQIEGGFTINHSNDVPYLAGASNSSDVVNIDSHVPQYDDKVVSKETGEPLDLWKYLAIHETTEKPVMERLIAEGMPAERAYHIAHTLHATPAERAAVEADGGDWNEYEKVMDGYLNRTEHEKPENPPPDLYTKPYPHRESEFLKRQVDRSEEDRAADEIMAKAMARKAAREATRDANGRLPGAPDYEAPTERTAAGEQTLMPGVEPVTDAARAQAGANAPLRGGQAAMPEGGLFDEDAKNQIDLMDMVPTEDGLMSKDDVDKAIGPETEEDKTFFQSANPQQLAITRARQKRQLALARRAQAQIVRNALQFRTPEGHRDVIHAFYAHFEDFGYAGFPNVRFTAEALTAEGNRRIAAALEHFARKTFYSDGSLVGGRRNRADFRELRRALMGEKTTPDMQRLASDLHDMFNWEIGLFNEYAGDTMGELKNWSPQSHDPTAVYRAGGVKDNPTAARANWVRYIEPLLDWTRMTDPRTGASFGVVPASGMGPNLPAPPSLAVRNMILENIWKDIVTDGGLRAVPGEKRQATSVANSRSDHRFLVFKNADAQEDYNRNYGHGDLLSQIISHHHLMARDIALMKVLGPNPSTMVDWMKQVIRQEASKFQVGDSGTPGRPTLLEGYSPEKIRITANRATTTLDGYYHQFRGDGHDQGTVALVGTILRNNAMGALLGSSVIPHAVANPFIQMFARYAGGVPAVRTIPHILTSFSKASKEEILRAGLDVEQGAYTLGERARYQSLLQRIANGTRWFPDRVTHLSGLEPFVQANRTAFRRDSSIMLADLQRTAWADLPAAVQRKMRGYGVDQFDWKIAQAATPYVPAQGSAPWLRPVDIASASPAAVLNAIGANPQGLAISPAMARNAERRAEEAAIRISAYILGETEVNVPTSSIRSRAFLIGDSDPNTFWGFLRRGAGMFKGFIGSFMISQAKANADYASRGARWANPRMFGRRINLAHAAALWIAMTILGTTTYSLKQMAAGKEAPSLDPTTPEGRATWLHGMLTGGAFGWAGDFLASATSSYGRGALESLAGPVPAMLIGTAQVGWDAFTNAVTKRPSRARVSAQEKAIRDLRFAFQNNFPVLSTLWYARAAYNRMILDQLQAQVDPQAHYDFRRKEKNLMRESNQRFWWRPGDALPREWPWQHKPY